MDIGTIVITGNIRFLGATVLHTISVAIVGVLLGLAYSTNRFWKFVHAIIGLALASGLHTVFNYFIMKDTRQGTIIAIAGIWIVAVIVIILFDRLSALEANIADINSYKRFLKKYQKNYNIARAEENLFEATKLLNNEDYSWTYVCSFRDPVLLGMLLY
jgi:hypothetical protein